jgi:hypothetical protein
MLLTVSWVVLLVKASSRSRRATQKVMVTVRLQTTTGSQSQRGPRAEAVGIVPDREPDQAEAQQDEQGGGVRPEPSVGVPALDRIEAGAVGGEAGQSVALRHREPSKASRMGRRLSPGRAASQASSRAPLKHQHGRESGRHASDLRHRR